MKDKTAAEWISENRVFFGDLHNHSGISYGHGRLEDALSNARQQLDFVGVTGHYAWPDMDAMPMPDEVVAYHREGFRKFRDNRETYLALLKEAERPGAFITFPSFEIHSFVHGDYTGIALDNSISWPDPEDAGALGELLNNSRPEEGLLLMPHHIGYKTGFRGINWETFREAASPVVEIYSMHGCAESQDSLLKYLHTMGPRDGENTMQGGLARGLHFGVTAGTDHHNSFPGSYGYGRTGVWAPALDRQAIWEGLVNRRTFALTGDRMELGFFVNGHPLGSEISRRELSSSEKTVSGYVKGGDSIERIEIIKNNRLLREFRFQSGTEGSTFETGRTVKGKLPFLFGWGERGVNVHWRGRLRVEKGSLLDCEPRFRGIDLVDPLEGGGADTLGVCPELDWSGETGEATFSFLTNGNSTAVSDATQQICLELSGTGETTIHLELEAEYGGRTLGRTFSRTLNQTDLPRSDYLAGFISPAFSSGRFAPEEEWLKEFEFTEDAPSCEGEWYYLRVFQKNGQQGWSSPIRIV